MLGVVRCRSQLGPSVGVFWIINQLVWRARSILMQNVFVVQLLLLSHRHSCPCFDLWIYTFDSSTFRSASWWHVLLSMRTGATLFWLQFPMFIYASGADSRLHWLLPWKFPSFKITTLCYLFCFFDHTCLKSRYFHSIFQVVLSIRFNRRTQRFQLFILVHIFILLFTLMSLHRVLHRFAILSSFLLIFLWIFITLHNNLKNFIIPSCCLSNLILCKLLRIMKLRILVLYFNLLQILNSYQLLHRQLLLLRHQERLQ